MDDRPPVNKVILSFVTSASTGQALVGKVGREHADRLDHHDPLRFLDADRNEFRGRHVTAVCMVPQGTNGLRSG